MFYILRRDKNNFVGSTSQAVFTPTDNFVTQNDWKILGGELAGYENTTMTFDITRYGLMYDLMVNSHMYLLDSKLQNIISKYNKMNNMSLLSTLIVDLNGSELTRRYKLLSFDKSCHIKDFSYLSIIDMPEEKAYIGINLDSSELIYDICLVDYNIVISEKVYNEIREQKIQNIDLTPIKDFRIPILDGVNDQAYKKWKEKNSH